MSDSRETVHALKNYLAIILGYSDLLLEEAAADDPHRADYEEIRRAANAALAVLDGRRDPSP